MTIHQPDRTIGGRTNDERARDAGAALFEYADGVFHHPSGEEIQTALQDLMCDLHHFLAAMGFERPKAAMKEALRNGAGNYDDESFGGEPHLDDEDEVEPPFAAAPWCDPESWMAYFREEVYDA